MVADAIGEEGGGNWELVLVAKPDVGLRARPEGLTSTEDTDVDELEELLEAEGADLEPLFGTRMPLPSDRRTQWMAARAVSFM